MVNGPAGRTAVRLCVRAFLGVFLANVHIGGVHAQSMLPSPWASRNVGRPATPGTVSLNSEVFTVSGAGSELGGTRDEFHFVYQTVVGDLELTARVDSLVATDPRATVGLMVRSGLPSTAAHGMVAITGSNGVAFQRRRTKSDSSTQTAGSSNAPPPQWLRIVRAGTLLTGYASPDGVTWTEVGSDTIALGTTAYVGIAITSHDAGQVAIADVSHVSLGGLPSPLAHGDVGGPTLSGSAAHSNGLFTVTGAGSDIWSRQDQFHFLYQQVTGDLDVIARVRSLDYTDPWAKAGVMIRDSLSSDSRHVSAFITPGQGYAFQRRLNTGEGSLHTDAGGGAVPGWVRLTRRGSLVEAFRSSDGVVWTSTGFEDVALVATVYVGVAVTSHNDGALATTTIDNFSVADSAGEAENQLPVVVMTAPAANQSVSAPATMTLAAEASDPEGRLARVDFYSGPLFLGADTSAPYTWSLSDVPAGIYTFNAVAVDEDGGQSSSFAPGTVTVLGPPVPLTYRVVFTASADHYTNVTNYVFEVFVNGVDLSTTALVSSDLGKPMPDVNRDIVVDRTTLLSALSPGTYMVTVSAIGPGGRARSSPVDFLR